MSTTLITYTDQTCIECGIVFGIPSEYDSRLRINHHNFYCPNGHAQHYLAKTEAEILRERLAEKERALTAAKCAEANERTAREKAERKLKRTCTRVKAGVCPCCNRTVKQLAAHMATKHPEFKA